MDITDWILILIEIFAISFFIGNMYVHHRAITCMRFAKQYPQIYQPWQNFTIANRYQHVKQYLIQNKVKLQPTKISFQAVHLYILADNKQKAHQTTEPVILHQKLHHIVQTQTDKWETKLNQHHAELTRNHASRIQKYLIRYNIYQVSIKVLSIGFEIYIYYQINLFMVIVFLIPIFFINVLLTLLWRDIYSLHVATPEVKKTIAINFDTASQKLLNHQSNQPIWHLGVNARRETMIYETDPIEYYRLVNIDFHAKYDVIKKTKTIRYAMLGSMLFGRFGGLYLGMHAPVKTTRREEVQPITITLQTLNTNQNVVLHGSAKSSTVDILNTYFKTDPIQFDYASVEK